MQAVLYVSHGTRLPEGKREAIRFIETVQQQIDVSLQEISFLELSSPTIAEGVAHLVSQGATAISVVPVLLLSAKHYHEDIPYELEQLKERYPQLHFTYGRPLGVQPRLIHILEERIREQQVFHSKTKVIVVGRGSKDPQTKKDIECIAASLAQQLDIKSVDYCFLAACHPSFDEALAEAVRSQASQVMVVPYLWFNGLLIRSMQKKINALNKEGLRFILCGHLGHHPNIQEALIDRVNESFQRTFHLKAHV
ncbi:sirohydrochlorin ferrochelatase [Pullulanibacillus camelliae]|uniref:Sirohydrochlorin ferrochelatase n=1 Tax=Pullulanibacillus camelliae TaxID=1707096 RepID=A0A8J2VKN8_9BACL|nr:sirohydrochlorin chelatase [Pullulanibacillus camelliae]GGE29398.1 sirohydrochlorin ferrochelatase [Pullulanibacillus camelliae]